MEAITSQKFVSPGFPKIAGQSATSLLLDGPEVLLSASDEVKFADFC